MATNRIEITVTMKNVYEYKRPAYVYGTEWAYIYSMEDEAGTAYVWKTTVFLYEEDEEGNPKGRINKGDVIRIKATVKGQSEYNGQPQTELTRVKLVERIFKAKTWEEIQEERKAAREAKVQEQRDSLSGEDFIWRMPYRQYKEHYSDCETIIGSFDRNRGVATIQVIVREGRLKASGVRGEHYRGYRLQNEEGEQVVYRAVKEENAIRRAEKEFGGTWECIRIYNYDRF